MRSRVVASLLLASACSRTAPSERAAPPPAALTVELAGCARVRRQGAVTGCEVARGAALRLLVAGGVEPAAAESDRGVARLEKSDAGASARVVHVPDGATTLRVIADVGGRPAQGTAALLAPSTPPWLDDARARRGKGDVEGARALAAAHESDPLPQDRAGALGLLARIELAGGDPEKAFPLFRSAIALERQAGWISDAADDSFALAFALHQRSQRYGEARAVLDDVAASANAYPEGRARLPYYRGILAAETGDHRSALALLREAERRARDIAMDRLLRTTESAIAVEMQALGRAEASLEPLRALAALPDLSPCERTAIENNLGWGALLANEAAGEERFDAKGPLERAVAVTGCSDVYERTFALGNLARLAARAGDFARAEKALAEAKASVREPRGTDRLSWLEIEGRILVGRGRAQEGLARFDELLAKARAAVLLAPEWSAHVGRAEALEKLGRIDDAIAALRAAEQLMDDAVLLVPLGEGRASFASDAANATRAAISLLVKRGHDEEAMAVARRSHARVLASVERSLRLERLSGAQRTEWDAAVDAYRKTRAALDREAEHDWELPADALARARAARQDKERELRAALDRAMSVVAGEAKAPPAAGEEDAAVELVVHPAREGWLAFAHRAGLPVAVARVPPPNAEPAALGKVLFDLAARAGGDARVLHFYGYGAYRGVDVHALPVGESGAPLAAKIAVDYPIGLVRAASSVEGRALSLVVGDPSSDLPEALAEAKEVAHVLERRGPVRLVVRDEAKSGDVLALLAKASLFHYAGHGVFGGLDGMDSALPLAKGGALTVGDVLAAAPVPPAIVLAGCEAARSEGGSEGLGLAQAFVAAGAHAVIAPVRKVPDALAHRFAAHVATALADGETMTAAARDAAARVREADPGADWAAFRVVTR